MIRRSELQQLVQPSRAVQGQRQLAPAQRERLQHPREPEKVIGVEVGQEDLVQVDEPDVGAQQLALRPLAAVEQQAVAAAPHERRRGRAARRRHRAGRAEKDDVEVHARSVGRAPYGRTSTWPGTIVAPSSPFRCLISQIPSRGSEYPVDAIDQSVSCGCTT